MSVSIPLVLDASATLAWLVARADPAESKLAAEILLLVQQQGAVVPELWWLEVANGALVSERRGGDRNKTAFFFDRLLLLPIKEDLLKPQAVLLTVLSLARLHSLTVYDACYLELALRIGSPLATFNRKLAAAAHSTGIPVFGDPA